MGKQLEKAWKHFFSVSIIPPPPLFFLLLFIPFVFIFPPTEWVIYVHPLIGHHAKLTHTHTQLSSHVREMTQKTYHIQHTLVWGNGFSRGLNNTAYMLKADVIRRHTRAAITPPCNKTDTLLNLKCPSPPLVLTATLSAVYVTICKCSAKEVPVNLEKRENFITTSALDKHVPFLVLCRLLESQDRLLWCLDNLESFGGQGSHKISQEQQPPMLCLNSTSLPLSCTRDHYIFITLKLEWQVRVY